MLTAGSEWPSIDLLINDDDSGTVATDHVQVIGLVNYWDIDSIRST
jgi:hypothetical protein